MAHDQLGEKKLRFTYRNCFKPLSDDQLHPGEMSVRGTKTTNRADVDVMKECYTGDTTKY